MNYYRRYVGDFQADTMHLSMMEQGAYDRLLDYYYASEKPIPPNSDRAALICRAITPEERAAVTLVLETYFERCEDGWRHKRVEKEIQLAKGRSEAGTKAVNTRWHTEGDTEGDTEPHTERNTKAGTVPILSNHQPPTTNHQPPSTNHQPPETPVARRKRRAAPSEAGSAETRRAYEQAYEQRYGVLPTWNRRNTAQLASFVESVPREDAPAIAAWFLKSNRAFYVARKHAPGLLLSDAAALRTEWLTQTLGTETEARQADRTMATGNAFAPLLEEARKAIA